MRLSMRALLLAGMLAIPVIGQAANSQQDRMKDCNAQAAGKTGDLYGVYGVVLIGCISDRGVAFKLQPGKEQAVR